MRSRVGSPRVLKASVSSCISTYEDTSMPPVPQAGTQEEQGVSRLTASGHSAAVADKSETVADKSETVADKLWRVTGLGLSPVQWTVRASCWLRPSRRRARIPPS